MKAHLTCHFFCIFHMNFKHNLQRRVYIKSNINFLISQPKHILWVLKRTVSDGSFEHPKQMFKLMDKKIFTNLR